MDFYLPPFGATWNGILKEKNELLVREYNEVE
jgi:hypothetical protein